MKILEIEDLVKYYGNHVGVDGVSFSIEEGDIYGFIGPNGAGKSTTIRTILGLIKKTSGSVSIFGEKIENNLVNHLKNIGYLPSEVFYYDKLKAIDLLNYSASFYDFDASSRIKELAEYLELNLNAKIEDMSLGNKKKVGIIQGLIHSPKLIILDEPTSGLDPLMQQKFFNLLKEENKKGATILFSSHILSEVQKICNKVAIIKDGKIVSVEEIATMESLNSKLVELELNEATDEEMEILKNLPTKNFKIKNLSVSFLYIGEVNELIKKLGKVNIKKLEIKSPSLEDVFLHYYE